MPYTLAIAGKVPYLVALVALLGARAIVMKMALGALRQRSPIRLLFACPHMVDLDDILPLKGLLLVTMMGLVCSTHDHGGSEAPDGSPNSILSRHEVDDYPECWIWVGHPDDGSNGDGTGGGDECAGDAMHLTRRSPAEGGDSEIGGDGDGVVMARSLSTFASGGRDMEALARSQVPCALLMKIGSRIIVLRIGGVSGSSRAWYVVQVDEVGGDYWLYREFVVSYTMTRGMPPSDTSSSSAPQKALPGYRVGVDGSVEVDSTKRQNTSQKNNTEHGMEKKNCANSRPQSKNVKVESIQKTSAVKRSRTEESI
ncbi:hypothetical protein Tco_0674929 [Tanacetum coccineum]